MDTQEGNFSGSFRNNRSVCKKQIFETVLFKKKRESDYESAFMAICWNSAATRSTATVVQSSEICARTVPML
jgi:hypothetical protein